MDTQKLLNVPLQVAQHEQHLQLLAEGALVPQLVQKHPASLGGRGARPERLIRRAHRLRNRASRGGGEEEAGNYVICACGEESRDFFLDFASILESVLAKLNF